MLPKSCRLHLGFTLIELMITMGILTIILSFSMVALSNIIPKQADDTTLKILISDLATQQHKATSGLQESPDGHYGVRFEPTRYILFANATYNSNDSGNVPIDLPPAQQFSSIDLPDQSIVFAPVSGEVVAWDTNASSAALLSTATNHSTPFSINRYGVVFTP